MVIQEWETGVHQAKSFAALSITAIYKKHISALDTFQRLKPGSYHKTMHSLFESPKYGPMHSYMLFGLPLQHRDNVGEDSDLDDMIGEIDFDGMED